MQRHHTDHEITAEKPVLSLVIRILNHLTIVLALVLLILFLIDQSLRGEMSFLCNNATKWMLFSLCVLCIFNCAVHLRQLDELRSIRRYLRLQKARRAPDSKKNT
ncbi:MAG: hypothetical protein ACOYI5_09465 [Christensenellales bacterium]